MAKIGLGLITCNAPEKFKQSVSTIPNWLDEFVVVNDGAPYDGSLYPEKAAVVQHSENCGVAVTKNDAIRYLLDKDCDHIFIMEDDVLIWDEKVFEAYISASLATGILHFNYGLQGPYNRVQGTHWSRFAKKVLRKAGLGSRSNDRASLDERSSPKPRYVHSYGDGIKIAFYRHCVGAFSYYRKEALFQVGLMDENFYNAWEHVDHTYQLAKGMYTSPFWWFADLENSDSYLKNIPNCMAQSTIARTPSWQANVESGEKYFVSKEGIRFRDIENVPKDELLRVLGEIKAKGAL